MVSQPRKEETISVTIFVTFQVKSKEPTKDATVLKKRISSFLN